MSLKLSHFKSQFLQILLFLSFSNISKNFPTSIVAFQQTSKWHSDQRWNWLLYCTVHCEPKRIYLMFNLLDLELNLLSLTACQAVHTKCYSNLSISWCFSLTWSLSIPSNFKSYFLSLTACQAVHSVCYSHLSTPSISIRSYIKFLKLRAC